MFLFDLPTFQVGRNICHGSDAVESANKEIALWLAIGHTFRLNNYQRTYSQSIFQVQARGAVRLELHPEGLDL